MAPSPPPDELAELLKEVRRIEVQTRRLVSGVLAGVYASVFRGAGIEFDEVREYQEGDDPRTVDWNVTARTGRPFIKKHVDERELTVLFLLDLSASMSGGFGLWSCRQMAARLCACLALAAVRNNDKVGLVAFRGGVERHVPPRKGMSHALRVVRDCLVLPDHGGPTDLAPALRFAARAGHRHAILFVLSDFFCDGWQRDLALAAQRHDVVPVRLLPHELDGLPRGLWRLRDPESGQERVLDGSSRRVRARYQAGVAARQARTRQAFVRAGVDWMDAPLPRAPDPGAVARPILQFFQRRLHKEARL